MWKVVRIPAGDITNLHYNFVEAKPQVVFKANENVNDKFIYTSGFATTKL